MGDKKDRSLRRDKIKNGFEAGEPVSGSGLLSVTKGFQEHVAKKLSKALEKSIKEVEIPSPMPSQSSNGVKQGSGGVRLFSDSKNIIVVHSDGEGEEVHAAKRQSKPDLLAHRKAKKKRKKEKEKKKNCKVDSSSSSEED